MITELIERQNQAEELLQLIVGDDLVNTLLTSLRLTGVDPSVRPRLTLVLD